MTAESSVRTGAAVPSGRDVADFWFDPLCPWAWMTSRWVIEVTTLRPVDVRWHLMNLGALNEDREVSEDYARLMRHSWRVGRVVAAAAAAHGDEVLAPLYTALGTRFHPGQRRDHDAVVAEALAEAGLPAGLAAAADDETWDDALRGATKDALSRVGQDVGTPIIAVNDVAFFGPVVTPAPKGELAARLWDGAVAVASVPGFYELKRGRTDGPVFD